MSELMEQFNTLREAAISTPFPFVGEYTRNEYLLSVEKVEAAAIPIGYPSVLEGLKSLDNPEEEVYWLIDRYLHDTAFLYYIYASHSKHKSIESAEKAAIIAREAFLEHFFKDYKHLIS